MLRYTRALEIKELSVLVSKMDELKKVLSHDRRRRAEYGGSETGWSGEIAGVGNWSGRAGLNCGPVRLSG